jgi:hypothetical protein
MKGMAFQQAQAGIAQPLNQSVIFYGEYSIFTARRDKAAARRKKGGYCITV